MTAFGICSGRILPNVTSSTLTTQELLKHAEDIMRRDWEYLERFNAAVDALHKKHEDFQVEHPGFGDRYSQTRARI
jgi:hypothetical protein